MMFLTLAWFLFFPTTHAARSPVEKVVQLITELKAKIQADGANEEKIYNKFACWCETTTQRKANAIDNGKTEIGTTTTTILRLKSVVQETTNEITGLQAQITEATESMKSLTEVREKENSDWQANKKEMEIALNSLNNAINTLSGAGSGGDLGLLSVAVGVREAVMHANKLSPMSPKASSIIRSFLENPAAEEPEVPETLAADATDEEKKAFYMAQAAEAKQSYSPQSATIQGILKDMYETFATNLQDANQEESDKMKEFDDVIAASTRDVNSWTAKKNRKEDFKAQKNKNLASNENLLEELQIQLGEDETFFEDARTSCKRKSDEWDERNRMRTEELDGIDRALKVLTSDDARAIFANATSTRPIDTFGSAGVALLQTSEEADAMSPNEVAYRQIRKAASQTKSLRLATFAATVRHASEGHFNSVITAIDTMINTLNTEEAADIEQRDWCIKDRHENNQKKAKLEHEIKVLAATIQKLENNKAQMEDNIEKTTTSKVDLESDMEQALNDRDAENAAFTTAKSDDLAAIGLLEDAIAALSEYGNNMAMLQQPVFAVSEDQAPDATFSSASKYSGASNGIVGLLEQIKRELTNEVKTGSASETMAQNDYAKLYKESTDQVKSYNNTIDNLNTQVSETEGDILDRNDDKWDAGKEKNLVNNYLARIQPNCDWIEHAFEKRYHARKAEREGLTTAKATLSGAQGGEFGFMQKK